MIARTRIDFNQLAKPANLQNSTVLRMLEEEEARQRGGQPNLKRVAWPPPPEDQDYDFVEQSPVQAKTRGTSQVASYASSPASNVSPIQQQQTGSVRSASPRGVTLRQPSQFQPRPASWTGQQTPSLTSQTSWGSQQETPTIAPSWIPPQSAATEQQFTIAADQPRVWEPAVTPVAATSLSAQQHQRPLSWTPQQSTSPSIIQQSPTLTEVQRHLSEQHSQEAYDRPQGYPFAANFEAPPSTITLRPVAPISQIPAPVYQAQPAATKAPVSGNMRGDMKWPPASVKAQTDAENRARLELAKGPVFRPRRVNKDYSGFFAQHALNSTYPGYKAPPGTQYFTPAYHH
ncbi:uncharacterized protein [Prorops nasuta]|uniref:uncharacterized protein isoform X2 n=1 Tax=Prorops nasuta TaxID=863751 RepID=UPI0034CFC952